MANLLRDLRDLLQDKEYTGKVVGYENGKALIATEKGLERTNQSVTIGAKVIMFRGVVVRVLTTTGIASYEV